MVVPLGFEPKQTAPKTVVLPLHQRTSYERVVRIELTYPTWKEGIMSHYTILACEPPPGIEPSYPDYKSGASPAMLKRHLTR